MEVKKILFVNYSYALGSTGNLIKELQERLDPKEFYSVTVCKKIHPFYQDRKNILIPGNRIEYLFEGLMSRLTGLQGYGAVSATKKLIKYIKKEKPDIIHLHNLHGNYLNCGMLFDFLGKYNVPVIYTLHDCWAFTGNCSYYTIHLCKNWNNGMECRRCRYIKKYPPSWFFDRAHKMYLDKERWYDQIKEKIEFVTVSDWLLNEAKRSMIARYPVRRIYNWIDTEIFKPFSDRKIKAWKQKIGKKRCFFSAASIWSRDKGLYRLYELADALDDNDCIMLAGVCHDKISSNKIIYLGNVSDKHKMAVYYNVADVYINLSVEETFGLTTAEAMACGTPSIVMNATANPEIAGSCGAVIDQFDITMMKNTIEKLLSDTELKKKCRERALSMFTIREADQYISLYRKCVQ